MTVEFTKAHTAKDGKSYKIGQMAEFDDTAARELINQGVAKERPGQKPQDEGKESTGQPKH